MNMRISTLALLAWLLPIPAMADTPPDLPDVETVPVEPKKVQIPTHTRTLTFEQLGTRQALPLRGAKSSVGVGFGVRSDELVVDARLRVGYVYSPSMIDRLSHIKVYLNDEVVGILPITKERGGEQVTHELSLDPSLISDYNNLRLQLIGHYVLDHCEDPLHGSLWVDISGRSSLQLKVQPLALHNDLGMFPEPFFDARDSTRLTLPMVFASKPSLQTLEAAGTISSWFGGQAAWRGARFPVLLDSRPKRHAVVFASNDSRPAFLEDLPPVEEPTLEVISLPLPDYLNEDGEPVKQSDPYIKLLLVRGRDDDDLKTAAQALALGQAVLTGQQVVVKKVDIGAPRKAYDAPNWVRLDRPTKFGELVKALTELQVAGHNPDTIRVNLRVPADLFTWQSRGIPVDLKYRYTPMIEQDDSRLNVNINEEFVEAFNLRASGKGGVKKRVRVPLLDEGLFGAGNEFFIPAFKLGNNNQMQFDFTFGYEKRDLCKRSAVDNVRAAIDPDSTIDFTGFPHFVALPNLGFFANSGYPFTKHADLAQTTVVLSADPDRQELETLLTLIGHMGISTGYPAVRVTILHAQDMDLGSNRELLIIGSEAHHKMLERWNQELPASISSLGRELGLPVRAVNLINDWLGFDTTPDPTQATDVLLHGNGPIAGLLGFESPQAPGRSVVSVLGTGSKDLLRILDALDRPYEVSQMHGSTVTIRPQGIESILVGDTYTVGSLPLWTRVWYFLSQHPVMLATLTILMVMVIAFLLWRTLRVIIAQRVHEDAR